jgi:hypothetical protein
MSDKRYKIIKSITGWLVHDTELNRYAGERLDWYCLETSPFPFRSRRKAIEFVKSLTFDSRTATASQQLDPYKVTIGGVLADPYQIAASYELNNPMLFQALKKILRCGRKHKTIKQDVLEAMSSLQRWIDIHGGKE